MIDHLAKILIVEDVDTKFAEVKSCVEMTVCGIVLVTRATHLNQAEDEVMNGGWELLVLDLSMDIAATGSFDLTSGHATLGGLDVLERMSLLKISIPTILVTGFDSFQDPDRFDNAIMSLADVSAMARRFIGPQYLGYVRYGVDGWSDQLVDLLKGWVRQ